MSLNHMRSPLRQKSRESAYNSLRDRVIDDVALRSDAHQTGYGILRNVRRESAKPLRKSPSQSNNY